MTQKPFFALAALLTISTPAAAQETLPPGIWTNTEDEYFAEEEGRTKPEPILLEVREDRRWRTIDAFGRAQDDWSNEPITGLTVGISTGWQVNGSELRRAEAFSCWVSVRKYAAKPDGSDDWTFSRNLQIFDQGGRIKVSGEGVAPDVTIRMRNVTWARGSRNKPSRVLYIHKDDPVRAESYSWASPSTDLIGVNLRWVQASCSRTPSQVEGI